jgi:hypothetical protein
MKQLAIRLSAIKHALSRWLSGEGRNPVIKHILAKRGQHLKCMLDKTAGFRLRGNDRLLVFRKISILSMQYPAIILGGIAMTAHRKNS